MPPATHGAETVHAALERVIDALAAAHAQRDGVVLIGITDGGREPARRMARALRARWGREVPQGQVNASFHRDDIGIKPIHKAFQGSDVPFDIDDQTVVLVDDVMFTGRTTRAAINELFDHGRPARVELAVLVDRGGRVLPLCPTYVGLTLDVPPEAKVDVHLDPEEEAADVITVTTPANA